MTSSSAAGEGWRNFHHPVAFWFGAAASTAGVLLHLPMYLGTRHMGYRMAGMTPDTPMMIGLALIGVGLVLTLYGLMPREGGSIRRRAEQIRVRAVEEGPVRRRHVALVLVMAVAITIDNMKPITLSFVAPGVAREYGLRSPANPHGHLPVSLLPLAGIAGTVLGSLVWGVLSDRIGRRASILFASVLFITTAICGAMPGFSWNLLMCFLMGIAAGGMLPIAFTLMAETIPARHRSWLMVLIGGNVASAYVLTSWLAAVLTPSYGWRILWLLGIPTGLLLLLLNRWIPESPRYLLAAGRRNEAEEIMARYGATAVVDADGEPQPAAGEGFARLFRGPFTGTTFAIVTLAVGAGLVAYGFQLWVPTNLERLGFTAVNSDYVVRNAAVIGLPLTVLVAWMYGRWSSKKTVIAVTAVTALALLGFVLGGNALAAHRFLLSALLVVPLCGTNAVVAVVAAYSSETYPTRVRSRGTGLAAGMTKAGGVLIIAMVTATATVPTIAGTALIGVLPLALATAAFFWVGPETSRFRLEEIAFAKDAR